MKTTAPLICKNLTTKREKHEQNKEKIEREKKQNKTNKQTYKAAIVFKLTYIFIYFLPWKNTMKGNNFDMNLIIEGPYLL